MRRNVKDNENVSFNKQPPQSLSLGESQPWVYETKSEICSQCFFPD